MAFTVCAHCDKCYIESLPRCSYCGKTLNQQIFWKVGLRLKAKILKDWFWAYIERVVARITPGQGE